MKGFIASALAFVILSCSSALAQDIKPLGAFQNWSAWSSYENNTKVCYIYSDADTMKPENLDHGRVNFAIRHNRRSANGTEASLSAGYDFAPEAIRVSVDGTEFTMLPRGHYAWLRREEREREFMEALRKGSVMTVEAKSRRGNQTTYTFSLKGVSSALQRAARACR
ncbi:invasion associated locus B family protein [Microvirga rosea]|uniref:invasion associated locus B family protein n=1 Tax=Microvirga rosea TaxID=2715425 RepID=UPI001D0BBA6D|nr:invasion associated locus B family protein [Microvirga rosea]MCB8819907.1 invasion associated locus B family protein [Microvirga rosea]